MTPLRLFIVAVLVYLGWRMLRGSWAKQRPAADDRPSPGNGSDAGPQDVLVEDPVCHVLIPKNQAVRLRRDGVTYYFCSEACCDQFAGQPEKGET